MQLYEHEGKALLARCGLTVPYGALWPQVPPDLRFPVAVKAQVLAGGRGKRGGVLTARAPDEVETAARALLDRTFDGEPVVAVLVEEWMHADREAYLALAADRDAGGPLLLAGAAGGVDVERQGDVRRLPVDPLVGPDSVHVDLLSQACALPKGDARTLLAALWTAYVAQDALLVEVNPLGIAAGRCVALDARVFLDDSARFRHADWPAARGGTAFERACAALGSVGIEMDGDVAIITSGAGLGMASLDLLSTLGGTVRAVIDLGPVVFQQPERIADVVALAVSLRPRALLCNFFLQLVPCDSVASGIVRGIQRTHGLPVVLRMMGVRAAEARAILEPAPVSVYEDLVTAFRAAVEASGAA